jgi:hypothetical protein
MADDSQYRYYLCRRRTGGPYAITYYCDEINGWEYSSTIQSFVFTRPNHTVKVPSTLPISLDAEYIKRVIGEHAQVIIKNI